MAVIHILDKHTAELIAAGEVVERPASVVKELLENAIDAGATQITVSIVQGGIKQIEVADNGSGIETQYIPTAFIRHATSKIQTETDLESIYTLGFRGEALASIASVSRITLLTCTEQDEFACCYQMEGGQEVSMQPAARPVGTTITVSDLFYNTPARMKFLKKDSSEGTFVAETIQRIALSHPEISIGFVREGKQQFRTPGTGDLKAAVYAVLGRDFTKDLLETQGQSGVYQVKGLITPPRACRASRGMQYFYINGRFVKNKTMMAALETAYKGTVMQGKFPGCVLELSLPAELVDVNVHPAKTEVRFAREQDVFDAVYKAAKVALSVPQAGEKELKLSSDVSKQPEPQQKKEPLSKPVEILQPVHSKEPKSEEETHNSEKIVITTRNPSAFSSFSSATLPYTVHRKEPELDIEVEDEEETEEQTAQKTTMQTAEEQPTANVQQTQKDDETVVQMPQDEFLQAMDSLDKPKQEPLQQQTFLQTEQDEPLEFVGEVFQTYLITRRGQELCLIDKHAAHERLLYEKLLKEKGDGGAQLLLEPVAVQLSAQEKNAVLHYARLLKENGIEAEDFGGSSVLVRSVPADIVPNDIDEMMQEVAAKLSVNPKETLTEKAEWVLHSIACRAAVKAGDRNSTQELLFLAQQILSGEIPPFCPHGRPVVLKLTKKELEKQFGRQG